MTIRQEAEDTFLSFSNYDLILKNVRATSLKPSLFIFDRDEMPSPDIKMHGHYFAKGYYFVEGHLHFNNRISGKDSVNNILQGGLKDDKSSAGWYGDNILKGLDGNDVLIGGLRTDKLYGGPGHDSLNGRGGYDVLNGGAGDDILFSGSRGDARCNSLPWQIFENNLCGGAIFDVLYGDSGKDTLHIQSPGYYLGGSDADLFKIYKFPRESVINKRISAFGEAIKNAYKIPVIGDFDVTQRDEKIDLSDFTDVKSFKDLKITEVRINYSYGDVKNAFPSLFEEDTTPYEPYGGSAHYQGSKELPMLILSTKEQNPVVLAQILNVMKDQLKPEHFIFSDCKRYIRSFGPEPVITQETRIEDIWAPQDPDENNRSLFEYSEDSF